MKLPQRTPYNLRTLSLLLALLFVVDFGLCCNAHAQKAPPPDAADIAEKLAHLRPNAADSYQTLQQLGALDGDTAFAIVKATWNRIPDIESKVAVLNQITSSPSSRVLDMLDIAISDPALPVQNRALIAVMDYSFHDFSEDFSAYQAWRKETAGKTTDEVVRMGARAFAAEISRADHDRAMALMGMLQRINSGLSYSRTYALRRAAMIDAGLPDAIIKLATQPEAMFTVFQVLRSLRPGEEWMRVNIVPLTGSTTEVTVRRQAIALLGSADNAWAGEVLMKLMLQEYPGGTGDMFPTLLAQMGYAPAIPTLIGMLEADRSPEGERIIGYALNQFVGLNNGVLHDSVWWQAWWTRNSGRFVPNVRALPIPKLAMRARTSREGDQPVRPERHEIAGDAKRAYWLISPGTALASLTPRPLIRRIMLRPNIGSALANPAVNAAPPAPGNVPPPPPGRPVPAPAAQPAGPARGLLVVLTGGDGNGADQVNFWEDLAHRALKDQYYVAVVVAPRWSVDQSATWVMRSTLKSVKDAKFSIETLVADVVKDVEGAHAIAPDHVFLHGVAESGIAVYASSLEETTPFHGFYILSSAFKSAMLPPLTRAKGRRYYIQNSGDDKLSPFVTVTAAQKLLMDNGAAVKLDSYKSGHGYNFPDGGISEIAGAITWMESAH